MRCDDAMSTSHESSNRALYGNQDNLGVNPGLVRGRLLVLAFACLFVFLMPRLVGEH